MLRFLRRVRVCVLWLLAMVSWILLIPGPDACAQATQAPVGSVAWVPSQPPPATDPALVQALRVERGTAGAWLSERPLEAIHDTTTGAVLVGEPFDGVARFREGLCGLRSVGRELRLQVSTLRSASATNYLEVRNQAVREIRRSPAERRQTELSIQLERLFGYDVVFPRRSSRAWISVARPVRFTSSGEGLLIDLTAATGSSLRIVLNSELVPVSAAVNGTNSLILDYGIDVPDAASGAGKGAPTWNPMQLAQVVTAEGPRTLYARQGRFNLFPEEVHGTRDMLMAIDPETGIVLTRWDKWPSVWWSGKYLRLGGTLFEVGFSRSSQELWIAPSTNRIEIGSSTPTYVQEVGNRMLRDMREDRHRPCYRIDLRKLLSSQEVGLLSVHSVTVTPSQTAIIALMVRADHLLANINIEINEEVEVVGAQFPFDVDGQVRPGTPAQTLRIPENLVYLAQ